MADLKPFESEISDAEQDKICNDLKSKYDEATTWYAPDFKRMRLLDATDKGHLWKAIKAKFPSYQILPDTNHVSYIKQNLLASLYTVAKSASILPTRKEDVPAVETINTLMDNIWDTVKVPKYEYLAGERAALTNLGITQVGWATDMEVPGEITPENVSLRNIDPMRFMRDPYSTSLAQGGWACHWDYFDKSYFEGNSKYREKFKEFKRRYGDTGEDTGAFRKYDDRSRAGSSNNKTLTLVTYFVKETYERNEEEVTVFSMYELIDNKFMVHYKRDVKPSRYPYALLYCNLPVDSLVGVSEPNKIFANSIAYNLMDSLLFTAEYKNQRPPKFVSTRSNLNIDSFAKHGDDPDRAFIVNGDARNAVYYHEFPNISNTLPNSMDRLARNIQDMPGVDDRYTGRDTGSIITTGGTEEMLNRVTLIDAPKVLNYENYTTDLTELILLNLIEFSPTRTYLVQKPDMFGKPKWKSVDIDFDDLLGDKETAETLFRYSISISSELPKNKQRIAAWANNLMEKQMQYSQDGSMSVDLITAEEWLQHQDIPNKEYMLERMGVQRGLDELEQTAATIEEYEELIAQGFTPDEAMARAAQDSYARRNGEGAEMPGVAGDMQVVPNDVMGASPTVAGEQGMPPDMGGMEMPPMMPE